MIKYSLEYRKVYKPVSYSLFYARKVQEVKTKMKQKVTEKEILGTGKYLYLVSWSRCANFGYNLIRGDSEKEVYKYHAFSQNKEVNFIITKISKHDLPVIFMRGARMKENINHKGFNINFFICRKGFDAYTLAITKYKNKGYKEEKYFLKVLSTHTNKKTEALKIGKEFINNIKNIKWCSNGMLKCEYLPSIN